ncbi:thiamine biosynthesis protein ThiI [Tissierella praeacuta DSM 18095]|uniref:Probable tRNA sulfurtransferase n=1 Tax=Tissierella praeacuta DSM 18095 TaxID=1123404 RepID=A0A1M4ZK62_9FIRM|nr:tRNA uracil 4-sulfurtransferase ThiI [Tissierella praeacuta]TCU65203.1 thiamine biosynthesis protein ThiI [Tissierella praeacuta]SHF18358.1 thiamine biosynthesis protein ThiI [Tissierella praeacuta DSM 18095]SUP00677.1 Probable tRNA sulfurtransferase [Tissierella praeacuta]
MDKVLSVSLGEIALKGLNRKYFEDQLIKHMRRAIKDLGFEKIYKEQGKIYIEAEETKFSQMINRLRKVFGLVYISPCIRVGKDVEVIEKAVLKMVKCKIEKDKIKTFKIDTNRADKNFPIKSPDFSRQMGGVVLKTFNELSVDVHNPDTLIYIDIKQNVYIYADKIKGYGGMPIGTNGKGLLLLSGGIDSPVAGFLMAKRGVEISAVHYHSYPFTSERAEEKVKDLASILSRYTGKITMYSVNLLNIQKEINAKCPEKEMTILSRRFMMRIAEGIAEKQKLNALITGESLGQVASQTIEGISVTNAAVKLPVFRPLIGLDKIDIIEIAKDIETFETSTLPFEDCCTVFLPKHPVTKPKIEDIEKSEEALDINYLIDKAIESMTITTIE